MSNNQDNGNSATMRKALRALRDASRDFYNQILNSKYSEILDKYTCVKQGFPAVLDLRSAFPIANRALSAPPRNCDMGTAEEQTKRFSDFCAAHRHTDLPRCAGCPLENTPSDTGCSFAWAQTPYEEQKGGGDGR